MCVYACMYFVKQNIYIYIYIYVCIQTHTIYIYIYICVCIYIYIYRVQRTCLVMGISSGLGFWGLGSSSKAPSAHKGSEVQGLEV